MTQTGTATAAQTTAPDATDEQLYRVTQVYRPLVGPARARRTRYVRESAVVGLRAQWRAEIRDAGGEWHSDWVTAYAV